MKKVLSYILKFAAAAVIAFVFLNIFAMFYYRFPPKILDEDQVTYYRYEPYSVYSQGKEGFSSGHVNNEGYLNTKDYSADSPVDILIMGSSHMEALQIANEQSSAELLNNKLTELSVYNIGMSAHWFHENAKHVENALNKYNPKKYLIMEMADIQISNSDLEDIIHKKMNPPALNNTGLWRILKSFPFLILAHEQIHKMRQNGKDNTIHNHSGENDYAKNEALMKQVLSELSGMAQRHNVQLVLLFHPELSITKEGSIQFLTTKQDIDHFKNLCVNNHIIFLDMSDRFLKEYQENHILPYGFINTSVGKGHLNRYGHEMIADELYKLLSGV